MTNEFYSEVCNELYHHGIKGQKWGQRNGPPYPLDSNDHSTAERKYDTGSLASKVKNKVSSMFKSSGDKKTKKVSEMTDDELKAAINRMNLEQQYNSSYDRLHPQTVSKGRKIVDSLSSAAISSVKSGVQEYLTKLIKEKLGLTINDDELNGLKREAELLKNKVKIHDYNETMKKWESKAEDESSNSSKKSASNKNKNKNKSKSSEPERMEGEVVWDTDSKNSTNSRASGIVDVNGEWVNESTAIIPVTVTYSQIKDTPYLTSGENYVKRLTG